MAVTELIYFHLCMQLGLRHAVTAEVVIEPRDLPPVGQPALYTRALNRYEYSRRLMRTNRAGVLKLTLFQEDFQLNQLFGRLSTGVEQLQPVSLKVSEGRRTQPQFKAVRR